MLCSAAYAWAQQPADQPGQRDPNRDQPPRPQQSDPQRDRSRDQTPGQQPSDPGSAQRGMSDLQRGQQGMQSTETAGMPGQWLKSSDIIGREVRDSAGTDLGEVENCVMLLDSGHVLFAILSGDVVDKSGQQIAVPFTALRAGPRPSGDTGYRGAGGTADRPNQPGIDDRPGIARDDVPARGDWRYGDDIHLTLNITKDQLRNKAVAFSKDQWPNLTERKFIDQVYDAFGERARVEHMSGQHMARTGREPGMSGQPAGSTGQQPSASGTETASLGRWIKVGDVKGSDVKDASGKDLGDIQNLVIDMNGARVLFAIVPGDELDKGDQVLAVPWEVVRNQPADQGKTTFVVNAPTDRLKGAPTFDENNWPNVTDRQFMQNAFAYYNVTPYWQGGMRHAGHEEADRQPGQRPESPDRPDRPTTPPPTRP